MKLTAVLLLLATLLIFQTHCCSLCSKIRNCPKQLESDPYIDAIYD